MTETAGRFKPNYRILVFLFVSHFFSRWGDRMWSFGVPLFLVVIYCNSLILAALYGLILTIALTLFGTWVGDFVDATPRWKFVILTLFLNNLFIFLNSICLLLIIIFNKLSVSYWEPILYSLSVLLVVFGSIARLTALGTNISVEKDWVVVIAHKDKRSLACINTNLRRIDLICKLLAPVFITMIMHFIGLITATIVLALWNVLSFFVESLLITFVYNLEPNLATKEYRHKSDSSDEETPKTENQFSDDVSLVNHPEEGVLNEQEEAVETPTIRKRKNSMQNTNRFAKGLKRKLFKLPKNFIVGWKIYFRQKVWLVGISMSCLYLTVLGFSGVTAGYFYTQGMTELFLGLAQGVAGITGVGATFAFPYIRRLTGTVRTGIIGVSLQLFSLSFCVIGVFAPGNPTFSTPPTSAACLSPSINSTTPSLVHNTTGALNITIPFPVHNQYTSLALMVTGVVSARFGLWLFDLSVVQIVQENVIESERGIVNGIMSSMNFFNDMLHFLLVTIFPLPSQFGYLTILSFIAIATAWVIFFTYVLLHEREVLYYRNRCCGIKKRGFEFRSHDDESSEEGNAVSED